MMTLLKALLSGFAVPEKTKEGKATLKYNDKALPLTERQYNKLTKNNSAKTR
jgi:hypothetical protein